MNDSQPWPVTPGVHRIPPGQAEALSNWVTQHGRSLVTLPLGIAHDKAEVMAVLARVLCLPEHFGANLDALYDCLTDRDHAPQGVVLITGLRDVPGLSREALLEVFVEALDARASSGTATHVFWYGPDA
jgi:RNAse (barnase) inhibitor barstar